MNFQQYQDQIKAACEPLDHRERVALCLMCCNRLAPLYLQFSTTENWGDPEILRQVREVAGKWLAGDARIFIFDEPTRGVDVGAKVEIYRLMNRLTAAGAGILMISSELPELLGMSDRILVMHRGRVQAEFQAAAATQERVLSAALGLAS